MRECAFRSSVGFVIYKYFPLFAAWPFMYYQCLQDQYGFSIFMNIYKSMYFSFFFFFIFPLYSKGVRSSLDVYIAVTVLSPTLSTVATWSNQCIFQVVISLASSKKPLSNLKSQVFPSRSSPTSFRVPFNFSGFFFFLVFLGSQLGNMEVPRLGVQSEL